jgi:hypothetical protein
MRTKDAEYERQSEPKHTVAQKSPVCLARQARPDEQAGQKEHQRHQVDVLPGTDQVEAEKAMIVDDRERAPSVGRTAEVGRGRDRNPDQIGQHRMKAQDDQNDDRPQIA